MKTSELTGAALDWAVAKCEGVLFPRSVPKYSTDWAQGGPIIEEGLFRVSPDSQHGWRCNPYMDATEYYGPTPLSAAMRCYVASMLGDEVEIPKELT